MALAAGSPWRPAGPPWASCGGGGATRPMGIALLRPFGPGAGRLGGWRCGHLLHTLIQKLGVGFLHFEHCLLESLGQGMELLNKSSWYGYVNSREPQEKHGARLSIQTEDHRKSENNCQVKVHLAARGSPWCRSGVNMPKTLR